MAEAVRRQPNRFQYIARRGFEKGVGPVRFALNPARRPNLDLLNLSDLLAAAKQRLGPSTEIKLKL